MNKQRAVLLSALGLGLGLLALDGVLSGPDSADAATEATPSPVEASASAVLAAAPNLDHGASGPMALAIMASRLQVLHTSDPEEDGAASQVFSGSRLMGTETIADVLDDPIPAITASEFEEQHRIVAIMAKGAEPGVFIDKRFYRSGSEIDGMTIVEIHERSVVLESPQGRIKVGLKDPDVELLDR